VGNSNHGDYIIYADESGDHSMNDTNKLYPAFVLAFCVFSKKAYLEEVIPIVIQELVFRLRQSPGV
jgi:hypothetical protein